MAKPTVYIKGDWNAVCDECGRRFRASQLRKRWDGLMVCPQDFEVRHPQEFVRAKPDVQTVPWTRPEPTAAFIIGTDHAWVAAFAVAGYMVGGTLVGPGPIPAGTFTP